MQVPKPFSFFAVTFNLANIFINQCARLCHIYIGIVGYKMKFPSPGVQGYPSALRGLDRQPIYPVTKLPIQSLSSHLSTAFLSSHRSAEDEEYPGTSGEGNFIL